MDIMQILNGAKTGTLDAKAEVMNMLSRMTPEQRQQAARYIPQVEQVAKQVGVDLGDFKQQVSAHL